jgi:hypothetical protein
VKPLITLSRAMVDPDYFGHVYSAASFWPWRVVGKLIDGIKLTEPRALELYKTATGKDCVHQERTSDHTLIKIILLAGRRAGKDRFLSGVGVWRAALYTDWSKHISAGEGAVVLLLGRDKKQSNILRRYCRGLLKMPLLAADVVRDTDEVIEFRNGASLEITASAYDLVRGRSAIAVLGSEVAFWRTDEKSANSDEEVISAATESMGMSPGGGLLSLGSSVYRKRGYMYEQFTKLHGNERETDLCWFTPSKVMNPRLPQAVFEKAIAENGPRGLAEYENIWREDVDDFITLQLMEACTDFGVAARPPDGRLYYFAYFDAATGRGDSVALCIGHVRRIPGQFDELVIDVIREKRPPFSLIDTIAEWAPLLKSYGIHKVYGDQFAFEICLQEWDKQQIELIQGEYSTGKNYLAALPLLTQKSRVRLIDNEVCRKQFASLQRHVSSGHETVEHPKNKSAHDDVATVVAGCLVKMASVKAPMRITPQIVAECGGGHRISYGFGNIHNPVQFGPQGQMGERLRGQMARNNGGGGLSPWQQATERRGFRGW